MGICPRATRSFICSHQLISEAQLDRTVGSITGIAEKECQSPATHGEVKEQSLGARHPAASDRTVTVQCRAGGGWVRGYSQGCTGVGIPGMAYTLRYHSPGYTTPSLLLGIQHPSSLLCLHASDFTVLCRHASNLTVVCRLGTSHRVVQAGYLSP